MKTDAKRALTEVEKYDVMRRDRYTCRYCGTKRGPFEIDHVYPHSVGGETSIRNSVTACVPCNRWKRNHVGIWPKPIGYFENQKLPHLPHIIFFALGLALVGNGFWNILDPVNDFAFVGGLSMFAGIVTLSFTLIRMTLGR